ncbi:MAG: hypothetical protein ACLS48_08515 [[Eubacterium] siraeum]
MIHLRAIPRQTGWQIAKHLIKSCIPVSAAAIVVNLSSFIDLITIPRCLNFALSSDPGYFAACFRI